jgi:pyruvate/2-oxoglutarate dehydrogenase complex dihydrolipoamide dehydrogenase (E3) component
LAPLDFLAKGRAQLAELPSVRLIEGDATRVHPGGVTLADGSVVSGRAALLATGADLVTVDAFGRTSAPGVYAAGDLVAAPPAVAQALATGQRAAVGVTRDLLGA